MKTTLLLAAIALLLPGTARAWSGDPWAPISRATIKANADQMIDSTWTPNNTFVNYQYGSSYRTYYKGTTYTGVAYSQNNPQENWSQFSSAVSNTSGGNVGYGNDCSGFVSICWRLPSREVTAWFESKLGGSAKWYSIGDIGSAPTAPLVMGDALNSSSVGHIVLFLNREASGVLTMEQTPSHAQRKVRSYSNLAQYRPIRRMEISDAPNLTGECLSRVVDEGNEVSLSVSAEGAAPLTYQWLFNGNSIGGATTSQLTLPAARSSDAGNYECVVANSYGSVTSRVMTLTVYPPQTTVFLDDFDVNSAAQWRMNRSSSDTRALFNYDYSAMGIPSAPHSTGGTTRGLRMEANMSAGVKAAVSLSPLNQSFAGDHRLRFDLWMNANGPFPLGGNGSSQHATAGIGTAGNRVQWTGSGSTAEGYWFAVDGEGQAGNTSTTSGDFCVSAGATLQQPSSGVYTAGTESTAKGNIHPYYTAAFPGGTEPPAWQQNNYAQQSGTLAAGAIGFQWREVIVARRGNVVDWAIDGVRLATFTDVNFSANNVFVGYWDMFTSLSDNPDLSFGLIDNVRVEVPTTAPAITTQPRSQTVMAGQSVSMTVSAAGQAPLSYQWQCWGTNLAGTTGPGLVWANVTTNQSGPYTVVVANEFGAVTSQVATLTVHPPSDVVGWSQLWSLAPSDRPYLRVNSLPYERGMAYNPVTRRLLLVTRNGPHVYVLDADTGADVGELSVSGISGGVYPLLMVGVAEDGAVYAGNLTIAGTTTEFRLYRWESDTPGTAPSLVYAGDPGAGNDQRWGDTLDVRGAGADTQVILASRSGNVAAVLTTVDGLSFTSKLIHVADVPDGAFGLGLAFGAGDSFWGKATSHNLRQVSFNLDEGTGVTTRNYPAPDFPGTVAPIGVSPTLNLLAGINVGTSDNHLALYDLTLNNGTPVFITSTNFASDNDNSGTGTGAVDFGDDRVYALGANNGLVALQLLLATEPAEPGHFMAVGHLPDGTVRLDMSGTAQTDYILEWTSDWQTWSNLCTLSASNGLFWWIDPCSDYPSQRFYRLRLVE